jgi:ER membrane protein complex subunit 7
MHLPLVPSLLALLLPLSQCTHLRILVPSTPALPNPATLPPTTSASLTTIAHLLHAPLRADNSFDFRNVSAGSYLLDIHSHTHVFAPLRVDVAAAALVHGEQEKLPEVQVWGTFRGNEWGNKGEKLDVLELKTEDGAKNGEPVLAFSVRAVGRKEYLLERQGCEFSPSSHTV